MLVQAGILTFCQHTQINYIIHALLWEYWTYERNLPDRVRHMLLRSSSSIYTKHLAKQIYFLIRKREMLRMTTKHYLDYIIIASIR